MSSRCSSTTCLNGNCQGCRNGSKYCNDPRCYPNCPDCTGETSINCVSKRNGWDWALLIIITGLSVLLLILIGMLAWGWYDSQETVVEDEKYYPVEYQYQNYPVQYPEYKDQYQDEYVYQPMKYSQEDEYVHPSMKYSQKDEYVYPSREYPHEKSIDASLDVNFQETDDIPLNDIITETNSVNLEPGNVSVASARNPPPLPINTSINDSIIRGF